MKFKDLTEITFNNGQITVLYRADDYISPKGYRCTMWHCLCRCGKEFDARSNELLNGSRKSCGCLKKEATYMLGKLNKKYNEYDLSNEYGIGYDVNGKEFYFDLEDYDKIKHICWHIHKHKQWELYYVEGKDSDGHMVSFHRTVLGITEHDVHIDHINHNGLDNRKINLRISTNRYNQMNKGVRSDNTSGCTGVQWHKATQKWVAVISYDKNRKMHLGSYDLFEDAVCARKAAEEKYFGEWSYDNSQKMAEQHRVS